MKVWTHLTGVFDTQRDEDPTNDTIQLFVNGRPQGNPVVLHAANAAYAPGASSAGMMFGRSKAGDYFSGRIDEVVVWQRELTSGQVREDSAMMQGSVPATELVAHWNATDAANGMVTPQTQSKYAAGAMSLAASGVVADVESDTLVFDGESGAMTTQGPVVDETGSFTVTAFVQLDSAKLAAKPVGYRGQVFGQRAASGAESSWAIWVEKLPDDLYMWSFGRTATDAGGNVTESASIPVLEPAELDTPVQVTGVFNATEARGSGYGDTHLFVTTVEKPQEGNSAFSTPVQGSGELAVGRGSANGTTGHYLPGAVAEVRIWVGAMTANEVSERVLGSNPDVD
ncbi:LamG-like jellyroll fold domain-containing protein [Streptomyces sp. HUAS ZL42]|uniref:LamG-like jellyroll fold domain-containing protein n=1 Tax=Streptomyces sp. HUAS ZL42 TaxID=3231715 RepID=UPI00345E7D59